MRRKLWFLSTLVIASSMFVVACSAPPAGGRESSGEDRGEAGGADSPSHRRAHGAPKPGRGITVVQGPEPLSLDPSVDIGKTSINVQQTILNPLVNHMSDNQTIPWLATEWKAVAPTRWRIKLREGVTFHNGEPFNADSVVFSINTYNSSRGEGSKMFKFVKEAVAVDEYTVDIVTEKPNPFVPESLAFLHARPPSTMPKWVRNSSAKRRSALGRSPSRSGSTACRLW